MDLERPKTWADLEALIAADSNLLKIAASLRAIEKEVSAQKYEQIKAKLKEFIASSSYPEYSIRFLHKEGIEL